MQDLKYSALLGLLLMKILQAAFQGSESMAEVQIRQLSSTSCSHSLMDLASRFGDKQIQVTVKQTEIHR